MSHTNHNKTCKELKWGWTSGELRSPTLHKQWRADLDLWYCYDCKTETYFDWHLKEYIDIIGSTKS